MFFNVKEILLLLLIVVKYSACGEVNNFLYQLDI